MDSSASVIGGDSCLITTTTRYGTLNNLIHLTVNLIDEGILAQEPKMTQFSHALLATLCGANIRMAPALFHAKSSISDRAID